MRIVFRRGNGEAFALTFPVIVTILLILLATIGGASVAVVKSTGSRSTADKAETRMGPARNYAALPEMSVSLGGGSRTMDLKVKLELDPMVDPKITVPYATRIADRLSDRMREMEPERLAGADGAKLMKSAISSVVNREVSGIKVRDVLLESMVIR